MVSTANNIQLNKQPFSYAHVAFISGDQGGGKSVTAVARNVDAYFRDCIAIYCRDKLNLEVIPKSYDRKMRVAKIKYDGETKLIRIPIDYKLKSPMRIFCNFHLYGIPYVYCSSFEKIAELLDKDVIKEGRLTIDEYYIGGNARESMTALGKRLEKHSFQYRKRQLDVDIICPMARLADWTTRVIPTERILCHYNEKTRKVTLSITKRGVPGTREVTYDATQYFPNYWTNERINK